MIIVLENQLLSPIDVYKRYFKAEKVLIEQYDNYNKRTYRNRFEILAPNGSQIISIPLEKGKNSKKYKEVIISYDNRWIQRLRNTLKTCYGSAAYFEYFFEDIMNIFDKKNKYLFDLNTELREYLFNIFEIEIPIEYTSSYVVEYQQDVHDLRDFYTPVSNKNIIIEGDMIKYPQVFEANNGFKPNPSILDLLFNMGKYGTELLEK